MASVIRGNDNFDSSSIGNPTAGAVGTYALLGRIGTGATKIRGDTIAGSEVRFATTFSSDNGYGGGAGSYAPSGTWRVMGSLGGQNGSDNNTTVARMTTLMVRIS
jgi:hypothetical protein